MSSEEDRKKGINMGAFLSQAQHEVMMGNQDDIEKQVDSENEEGL